jgi:hypothetical protein
MNASKLAIARNFLRTQRALAFSQRLKNEDFESMMNNVVTGKMAKMKMGRFHQI